MELEIVPCLNDNYAYLLHDATSGETVVVDPSEAAPVEEALKKRAWKLTGIWNTHHHSDHVGGNPELKKKWGVKVFCSDYDLKRIEGADKGFKNGETFKGLGEDVQVISIPGHTLGHCALFLPKAKLAFVGDTLFSMGCGRLFEGTAPQMWESLQKLCALPDDTKLCPGHEYTEANGRFALAVEEKEASKPLKNRIRDVKRLREAGQPTVPVTLKVEKETNPFLRVTGPVEFAELRRRKDAFA